MIDLAHRSCGNGHWINPVVGIGIALVLFGIGILVARWVERRER